MITSHLPFITICMPVRNEERFVGSTLSQLLSQEYPADRYEIIVADGRSTDKTNEAVREIAEDNPQVILMPNPGKLPSSGRNVGFKNGRGDIFLVVDGHCKIDNRNLLQDIVRCFEKSGAQCLGRPQPLNPPDITDFQRAVAIARSSAIGHDMDSFIYSDYEGYVSPVSHGAIYRREVFEKIGYVDETFDACEDVDFNYRVERGGLKAYMSPALAIKYYPRESLTALFKQMKRYGVGRFRFLRKHPEALSITMIVPFLFVSWFLLALLIGILNPFLFWAFGLTFLVYISVILFFPLYLSFKHGLRYLRHLLPIFFAIHFGLGWGFLNGCISEIFAKAFRKPSIG